MTQRSQSASQAAQAGHTVLQMAGLDLAVDVLRDRWGIAHIRARSDHDAFFAQGYVHAQDRLWQMDACRMRMAGGWSQWAGPSGIAGDTLARRLGGNAASQRDWAALGEPARLMLQAYSDGVNALLK